VRVWVVGGTQGRAAGALHRDHSALYVDGVLAAVLDGELRRVRGGLGRCIKGAAPAAEGLWVAGGGAVRRVHDAQVVDVVRDPGFEDVHHAAVLGGRLHVASTGTDAVWSAETGWTSVGGSAQRAHPNHLFAVAGRRFVTRGLRGDALGLDDGAVWPLAPVVVHDGVVRPDGVWFTSVDGALICVDPETGEVVRRVDLTAIDDRPAPLGWCRGLAFVDGIALVGFTRLRATRMRQRLAWVRGQLRGQQIASAHPTRVAAYDLGSGQKRGEVVTEAAGLDAVFGLLPG